MNNYTVEFIDLLPEDVEEFVRQNTKNPQLTKTFFIKYFEDVVQTQGLL